MTTTNWVRMTSWEEIAARKSIGWNDWHRRVRVLVARGWSKTAAQRTINAQDEYATWAPDFRAWKAAQKE